MAKKTELNAHARNYIQAVFEERLRASGFSCPDDKLLCWYRLMGGEVMNSIIFVSSFSSLPLHLDIRYGIYPVFEKSLKIPGVKYNESVFTDQERFARQSILEDRPVNAQCYTPYSAEIEVYAPKYGGKGIFTLDQILLPLMDGIQTINQVYEHHKRNTYNHVVWSDSGQIYRHLSLQFIRMALYIGDSEVYPHAIASAENTIRILNEICLRHPDKLEYRLPLEEWNTIHNVLIQKTYEEYREVLEQRQYENLKRLKKDCGILTE